MSKKRLILLFDGTWNDPEDKTNVYRLAKLIENSDNDISQKFFYDSGVGTGKGDRILGGFSGYGLTKNLLEGYEWLAKKYSLRDEIWIFGFSRGAFTARSLVGLIRKCGLLQIVTPSLLGKAEEIYRNKVISPDCKIAIDFRVNYSENPRIHFIGVWDTVGSLGIPGTNFSEKGVYSWHDTELSSIVDHAYHAMALDEHREAFDITKWTSSTGDKKPNNIDVEQRWFIGDHSNIGGGHGGKDKLPDISLNWMIQKAKSAGLKLNNITFSPNSWEQDPNDSFKEFLFGLYSKFKKRHFRNFNKGIKGALAVNVTIDPSVWQKWNYTTSNYRPQTLVQANLNPPPQ